MVPTNQALRLATVAKVWWESTYTRRLGVALGTEKPPSAPRDSVTEPSLWAITEMDWSAALLIMSAKATGCNKRLELKPARKPGEPCVNFTVSNTGVAVSPNDCWVTKFSPKAFRRLDAPSMLRCCMFSTPRSPTPKVVYCTSRTLRSTPPFKSQSPEAVAATVCLVCMTSKSTKYNTTTLIVTMARRTTSTQ